MVSVDPKHSSCRQRDALRIALLYAALASLWIVASDLTLALLNGGISRDITIGIAKGLAFVAVTSVLLYLLMENQARKAAVLQHEVATAEHSVREVVEQASIGVYILQDGRFAYVNPYFVNALGYAGAESLIGGDPLELVAPADRDRVAASLKARTTGTPTEGRYSFVALRRDGSELQIGVHGMRVNYQGRPAILGFAQDITDRVVHERQIQKYMERLEFSMHNTLRVASRMVELRDPYTQGHERRVGELCAAIGAELGMSEDGIEGLRIIGNVHDVGKIAAPAEILSKPTRLSVPEFELVKQHSHQGHGILQAIEFPWPVAQATLQHHERMDGSGYPNGVRGQDILLEARILGVADTVEAMASHRPYRPGLGIDAALGEIEKNRGRFYDPRIAEACLRLFRDKGYALAA